MVLLLEHPLGQCHNPPKKYFHYTWVPAPATDCDSSIMLPQRLAIERSGEGRFTPWSRRYPPSPPRSATAATGPQDLISFTGNLFQLRWFSGKKKQRTYVVKNIAKGITNPRHTESDMALLVMVLVTALVMLLLRSTLMRSSPTSISTPWPTITLAPGLTLAKPMTAFTVAPDDGKHTQVHNVVLASV